MRKRASLPMNIFRIGRRVHKTDKDRDEGVKGKIKHEVYKKHFPSPSLLEQYLKTASVSHAQVLAKAAKKLLERR